MGMRPRNDERPENDVTRERAQAAADFLRPFAHTNRLLIVCFLVNGERSVGELEALLGLRQPALSQQLGELREAGIIEGRREAKQVFYRIADARALALVSMLHSQFCGGGTATSSPAQADATPSHSPETTVAPSRRLAGMTEAARFARIEGTVSSARSGR